jgi:hypothetical protein
MEPRGYTFDDVEWRAINLAVDLDSSAKPGKPLVTLRLARRRRGISEVMIAPLPATTTPGSRRAHCGGPGRGWVKPVARPAGRPRLRRSRVRTDKRGDPIPAQKPVSAGQRPYPEPNRTIGICQHRSTPLPPVRNAARRLNRRGAGRHVGVRRVARDRARPKWLASNRCSESLRKGFSSRS